MGVVEKGREEERGRYRGKDETSRCSYVSMANEFFLFRLLSVNL